MPATEQTPQYRDANKRREADTSSSRALPNSVQAENAVLACCILMGNLDGVGQCIDQKVGQESFYMPQNQLIFKALTQLYDAGTPIDEIIVIEKLQANGDLDSIGGPGYIAEISNLIQSPAHLPHYIKRVQDTALLRELIRTCQSTVQEAYTGSDDINMFINGVEKKIFELSEGRITTDAVDAKTMADEAVKKVHFLMENRGAITGVTTGFRDLDILTTGLHSPQMVVVAARPGMGKTSMALNMAEAAVMPPPGKDGVRTLMFSLEMGADELAMRMLCSRARVNQRKLQDGFLPKDSMQDLSTAAQELKRAPLHVDDSTDITILEMRAKARRHKSRHGLDLVIIDYLQLVKGNDSSAPRHEQLGEVSRGIKNMAKELKIPVIALCQLNRETEKEKRQPRISDLRESGSIEQDADIVLLISGRKDHEDNPNDTIKPRELIVAKQRNGPTGSIRLVFNSPITRFQDEEPHEHQA